MNDNENKNLIISKKELEDLQEMFKERDEIKAKLDMTKLNLKRKILATHKRKLKKVILEIENAQNKLEKLENEFKNTIRYIKTLRRKISVLCQIYGHEWHFENIATREFIGILMALTVSINVCFVVKKKISLLTTLAL